MAPSLSYLAGHAHQGRMTQPRRALVTGATGFVGSWLVMALLERGAHVVAFVLDADPQTELYRSGDASRCAVVNGNLEDVRAVERAIVGQETDTVFHLGAQAIVGVAQRAPLPTLETNVRGTWNVLEACRLHASLVRRLVIASSDKAYGAQPRLPYTEDMPLAGTQPYEVSKSAADLIAQAYHATYGLPLAIARCGNVYGGGDLNWSRIVPGTIRALLRGERPIVRSDGTYVRDYFYVKDAAAAYLRLAERLDDAGVRGGAFNFSTESPVTVLEIVRALQKATDATHLEPDVQATATGEIRDQRLSAAKARAVLRWQAQYDLDRALAETVAWYRAYLKA
jgi:CDP-glucose 4,6-dehydratase